MMRFSRCSFDAHYKASPYFFIFVIYYTATYSGMQDELAIYRTFNGGNIAYIVFPT